MITQEQQTKYSARIKKYRGEVRGKIRDGASEVQKEHGKVEGECMFTVIIELPFFFFIFSARVEGPASVGGGSEGGGGDAGQGQQNATRV